MNAKPFKVGDNVFAGMGLVEIPIWNPSSWMGKWKEIDRGRIALGQDVRIRADSLPEITMATKIKSISRWLRPATSGRPRQLPRICGHREARSASAAGMNGGMDIIIKRIPDPSAFRPRRCSLTNGKPRVYWRPMEPIGPSKYRYRRGTPMKWP